MDGTPYTAEHIVVATGADPAIPPVPGLRELPGVWTDREVTGLTEVPARLLVLGGGAIGVEMAQAVRRLGRVGDVVERGDHLLPREPRALGEGVARRAPRTASSSAFGLAPTAAPAGRRRVRPRFRRTGREARGDRLLVATGRRPRVEGIGLETVGVTPDPRGIAVDAGCRPDRGCGRSVTSPGCGS